MTHIIRFTAVILLACIANSSFAQIARQASRIFVGVLDEAQAARVWGERVSAAEARSAIEATRKARDIPGLAILAGAPVLATMADDLERQLRNATAGVVTLIGHNDNGYMRFGDGSSIELAGIAGRTGGASMVLVSCESEPLIRGMGAGIATKIDIDVAVATESLFRERLETAGAILSPAQLQALLKAAHHDAVRSKNLSTTFRKGGTTLAGSGIVVMAIQKMRHD